MFNKYPELLKKHIDFAKVFEDSQSKYININNINDTIIKVNNRKSIQRCECGKDDLIEDFSEGVIICRNCGQVLEELLDENPEWKHYDDCDMKNARCGAQINGLLPQSAMGTTIGGRGRTRMKIIQSWHSMPYKERSLNNELKKIHEICQKMEITKCIEDDTQIMYKIASECKHKTGTNEGKYVITRGKNRTSIMAACMYFACAKKGMMYTPREIAERFKIKYAEMNRGIKNLRKLIDTTKQICSTDFEMPNQFIRRYCNSLKMLNVYSDEAIKVSTNIEKLSICTEHNPYSVAAACILLIADKHKIKHVTRKRLAAEFGISDVTINKTYKKIEIHVNTIFDDKKVENLYIEREKKCRNNEDDIPDEIKEKMKQFGIIVPTPILKCPVPVEIEFNELVRLGKQLHDNKDKINKTLSSMFR